MPRPHSQYKILLYHHQNFLDPWKDKNPNEIHIRHVFNTCIFLYHTPNLTYRKIVHSSPPRQDSISMYKYFLSLKVLKSFTMKGQSDSSIISFSDMICCCCRVSTIYESKEISIFILIDRWNDENYSYSKFPFCISIATWLFFICLSAKDFCFISPAICTSSTRPKPPTPNVAIILKSCSFRLLNSSWIL